MAYCASLSANPKSISLSVLSVREIIMFSGLISLCTIPRLCKYDNADNNSSNIWLSDCLVGFSAK